MYNLCTSPVVGDGKLVRVRHSQAIMRVSVFLLCFFVLITFFNNATGEFVPGSKLVKTEYGMHSETEKAIESRKLRSEGGFPKLIKKINNKLRGNKVERTRKKVRKHVQNRVSNIFKSIKKAAKTVKKKLGGL